MKKLIKDTYAIRIYSNGHTRPFFSKVISHMELDNGGLMIEYQGLRTGTTNKAIFNNICGYAIINK